MGNKKNNKNGNYDFSNGIKQLRTEFKKAVDSMPDEEFLDFISFITYCTEDFDDDNFDLLDDDFEDDLDKFYFKNNDNLIFGDFNKIDDEDLPILNIYTIKYIFKIKQP